MNGTAFFTQCLIASGYSFLYNFGVPNQAGMLWYYSHFCLQYCEELHGLMIIYDPQDPYLSMYDVDNCKYLLFTCARLGRVLDLCSVYNYNSG